VKVLCGKKSCKLHLSTGQKFTSVDEILFPDLRPVGSPSARKDEKVSDVLQAVEQFAFTRP